MWCMIPDSGYYWLVFELFKNVILYSFDIKKNRRLRTTNTE